MTLVQLDWIGSTTTQYIHMKLADSLIIILYAQVLLVLRLEMHAWKQLEIP